MSRPMTKQDLLTASADAYAKLISIISNLSDKELNTPFDFESDLSKKEAHWKRDKNLKDILIHLYEWHQLNLKWVNANLNGENKPFLPEPYNWKSYGKMNVGFWNKHRCTTLTAATELLEKSHSEVMNLAEGFTDEELFSKGVYKWTGNSALGSYFCSNMSSHYNWAIKKLNAHKKNCRNMQ